MGRKLRLAALFLLGPLLAAIAQPLITPDMAVMNLDDIGVYTVGYAYRGQSEQQFPLGWSGFFEDRTGVACLPYGEQRGRRVFLLHCPWRSGTGIAFQQFAFSVPTGASRVLLRGASAMKSDIITQSDGVTFRIFANGVKRLEYHQTNDVWLPFEFDFTSLRGSNLVVRFEVDPGPRNNASFDYSFWGDRALVLEGYTPTPVIHASPPPLRLSNLWSRANGDVAPLDGFGGGTSYLLSNDLVRFRYTGPDGVLEYQWRRPQSASDGLFGTLTLNAQMAGDAPVSVPLAGSASLVWAQTATPLSSAWAATNLGYTMIRSFAVGATTAVVRITGRLKGKSLAFQVDCDQPQVSALDLGAWGPVVRRRQCAAPFYSGAVHYLPQENLFVNAFLDWTGSAASSHNGNRANYGALTDGTRNRLRERVIFAGAWHQAEVLPNIPNPPSPFLSSLADRVVLDIWGGRFTNIAANLDKLADYGITRCVALIHDWQRSGYDNALPMHIPANASLGGDAGMATLVAAADRLGIPCALHENYVDYYPNYDFYDTNDIALDSAGKLQLAWYNPGTGIQSFAVKPNAILRLAATQSPEIHRRYDTRANYLDVHSAVPPWFHVDSRAGESGAGTFARVWEVHRDLWAYERATHTGPVFGEGNNHWYWSGLLDGVEAQFGSGWPGNGGFTAPLWVDFDLLKIHPLQFNHGMGYYERWWSKDYETNWAGPAPMAVLDQYRMQEVAYGHAGFLAGSVYDNVPLAWIEHHLLSPVMARYAAAKPVDIHYENSGAWIDATAAAKLDDSQAGKRVRVRYENGLVVTANGVSNSLAAGPWLLPRFGWVAEGAGIKAGTVLRDGVITDFADAGNTVFVNARPAADWNLSSFRRVHPGVAQFQQTTSRTFRVTYQWDVQDRLARDYRCFVHFCTNGAIRWQQDHVLPAPTSQWTIGQAVSDGPWTITIATNMPDGDYDWLIGLFDIATGARIRLQGVDDGSSRIRLGVVRLQTNNVTFIPETGTGSDPTPWYREHLNEGGLAIDFGDVRTDGSTWLRREGAAWVLKTWPRDRNFTLELSRQRFDQPAAVQAVGGLTNSVVPVTAGTRWRLPLNGAAEYRWTNSGARAATLVPPGATWKYLDSGTNLGAAWRGAGFDDGSWPGGPAQLGFGDGDEATLVASNRQITTYFRLAFTAEHLADLTALTLRVLRDDGAVVYLNDIEVFRSNLPAGPIGYATPATNAIAGAGENLWLTSALNPGALRAGTNLLAVEIHQSSATSSDISFDLELVATGNAPPAVTLAAPPDGATLVADQLTLAAEPLDPEDAAVAVEFFADGARLGQATALPWTLAWSNVPPGDHTLSARVTDAGGRTADSLPVRVTIATPVTTLVAAGADWKFRDTGADLGTAWREPAFDDSAWPSGPGQLGYGDNDEATVVSYGPNLANKYITTYFRRTFVSPPPETFTTVMLRLLRDDGAIVWLNGVEVFRSNLPPDPVDFTTHAYSAAVGGDESTNYYFTTFSSSRLAAGTNVLAVEIHQNSPESSDLSFDLELLAFPPGALPLLSIAPARDGVALTWPAWAADYRLEAASNSVGPRNWTPLSGAVATQGTALVVTAAVDALPGRLFRLRRP